MVIPLYAIVLSLIEIYVKKKEFLAFFWEENNILVDKKVHWSFSSKG